MIKATLATLFAALCLHVCQSRADGHDLPGPIHERDVREVSAKRYSELLRLACLNGWRYRPADIASGFLRHYEETRLVFIDQGYAILPDAAAPRLIVATIAMDGRLRTDAASEPSCFRARWSDE